MGQGNLHYYASMQAQANSNAMQGIYQALGQAARQERTIGELSTNVTFLQRQLTGLNGSYLKPPVAVGLVQASLSTIPSHVGPPGEPPASELGSVARSYGSDPINTGSVRSFFSETQSSLGEEGSRTARDFMGDEISDD